ncbi:branched-chain amino acid ABC transporter ATP-binding protein [Candidimonas nitroreducens]|uniref:Branched-chain amino acid ABC transporter ATP-binding protein n=2 Tax=Candidimonas nitroreducens TaxID=683354 RepID=A0A225N0X8_9BURK|nr:branched-chain amino acid ABC transporter ATP-binding protein [Candidimonas nitroreducens]
MSNDPVLSVKNLRVRYGLFEAVFDVSLDVGAGEAICLLGSNGAGKTTSLRAILGALPMAGGRIRFLGEDTTGLPAVAMTRRGMIYVPEGRELFPTMTVQENLELGAVTPEARLRMKDSLAFACELFPILAERFGQLAGTLSGGQQQMVAIGRGLMGLPKLLMLDEPSLGLAPVIVEQVYAALGRIIRTGATVVLVEQHVQHALELCQRGYVLEGGRVVQQRSTVELASDDSLRQAYMGVD